MAFFNNFPKILYNISGNIYGNRQLTTDLTFRFTIIKNILNNISAYYEYAIKEGETPEILADKVYGNPEAHWIILYANDIIDPQYDWPLDSDSFEKYIISKYGSVSNAHNTIHHYEKSIERMVDDTDTVYTETHWVDYNALSNLVISIENITPNTSNYIAGEFVYITANNNNTSNQLFYGEISDWDFNNAKITIVNNIGSPKTGYTLFSANNNIVSNVVSVLGQSQYQDTYQSLPSTETLNYYVIGNKNITEKIYRTTVSCYDYENNENEKRRNIKIIKKEYYAQIMKEYSDIVKVPTAKLRKLV